MKIQLARLCDFEGEIANHINECEQEMETLIEYYGFRTTFNTLAPLLKIEKDLKMARKASSFQFSKEELKRTLDKIEAHKATTFKLISEFRKKDAK